MINISTYMGKYLRYYNTLVYIMRAELLNHVNMRVLLYIYIFMSKTWPYTINLYRIFEYIDEKIL